MGQLPVGAKLKKIITLGVGDGSQTHEYQRLTRELSDLNLPGYFLRHSRRKSTPSWGHGDVSRRRIKLTCHGR